MQPQQFEKVEVARIEEQFYRGGGGSAFMIVIGIIAMVLAFVGESSAIRLAAWGAIWTGWNVLALISLLCSMKKTYYITRQRLVTPEYES